MSGRKPSKEEEETTHLGPGAYADVDPGVTHPAVPSTFFGTGRADDPHATDEGSHEGDVLVLNPEEATRKMLPTIPSAGIHVPALESEWALRDREVVGADGEVVKVKSIRERLLLRRAHDEFFRPEALDYEPDGEALRVRIKGAVEMDGHAPRKDFAEGGDASDLFGKYDVDYTLVEATPGAVDFSRAPGRTERELGDDEKYEGQKLDLDVDRGHEYLATKKLVV
ncbi:hypothetical protein T484DRAFT_1865589, partial [Baffinella frigidus]